MSTHKQTNKKRICRRLKKEYKKIKNKHDDTVVQKTALIVLGSSIIRVFKRGTKKDIVKVLQRISIDDMKRACKSKNRFKKWFIQKSQRVDRVLRPRKRMPKKESRRWAHATKITSLYLRDLLCQCSKKFTKTSYDHIEKMLYMPLDGIVLAALKKLCKEYKCGIEIPNSMSGLNKKQQFFDIQDCLRCHADKVGVPAIWFDDIWVTNR